MTTVVLLAQVGSFGLAVRLVLSMTVIIAGLYGVVLLLRRLGITSGFRRRHSMASITVIARSTVARRSSVSLLRVGSRTILIGISEKGVTFLAEGDDLDCPGGPVDHDEGSPERTFSMALGSAMSNMSRKIRS